MKTCTRCGKTKDEEEFYKYRRKCKVCVRELAREYARTYDTSRRKPRDPVAVRLYGVRRKYGLSPAEYEALPKACEICGTTEDLCVDHDHETGRVRGTLCRTCNLGIGKLKDDPDIVEAAARYLRK